MMMNYYVTDIALQEPPTSRGDYKVRAYDIDGDEKHMLGDIALDEQLFANEAEIREAVEDNLQKDRAQSVFPAVRIEVIKKIATAEITDTVKMVSIPSLSGWKAL